MRSEDGAALRRRLEHFRWRFPEYWMLGGSAAAWLFLATGQDGHFHRQGMGANFLHWMVMVVAMMLPIQIQGVRRTAEQSLWSRRGRPVAGDPTGYVSGWAVVGLAFAWASAAIRFTHTSDLMGGAAGVV